MAIFIRPIGVVRRDRAVGGLHLAGPRLHRLHAPHTLPRPRHNPSRPRILTQPRCPILPPIARLFRVSHTTPSPTRPYIVAWLVAVLTACALWWVAAVSPDNPWDYERKKPPETIKINVHGENLRIKYCGTSLHRHRPFSALCADVRVRVWTCLLDYARLVSCRHVPHLPTTASHSLLRVQQLRRPLRPPLYPSPPLRVLFSLLSSLFSSPLVRYMSSRVVCC